MKSKYFTCYSKQLHIRHHLSNIPVSLSIGEKLLDLERNPRLLGIYLDKCLDWSNHLQEIIFILYVLCSMFYVLCSMFILYYIFLQIICKKSYSYSYSRLIIITSCYGKLSVLKKLKNFTTFNLRKQLAERLISSKVDFEDHVYSPLTNVKNCNDYRRQLRVLFSENISPPKIS